MSHPLFDLHGKTALITGSSRGLGRAIAEGLAQAGAKILVNGTGVERTAAAQSELVAAGFSAEALVFDVTDEKAVAPYTVAKGGIKMLTKAMAAEWAVHGLQANAIGPGYMLTDMNQALIDNPTFDAWVKGRTPAKRWGKPEELVGAAIFLASDASNYVNGQVIYVDGGMISVL